jgi:hypothetical protein
MLADNKIGDLGENDRAELTLHLEALAEQDNWDGTGYQQADLDHYRALEAAQQADPDPPPEAPVIPPPPPALREIVLLFSEDQQHEFAALVRELRARYKLEGVTDTVLRAIHDEALAANQG